MYPRYELTFVHRMLGMLCRTSALIIDAEVTEPGYRVRWLDRDGQLQTHYIRQSDNPLSYLNEEDVKALQVKVKMLGVYDDRVTAAQSSDT